MLGYYWVDFFFVAVNVYGVFMHIALYFIDLKRFDGILNKVDAGDTLDDLITSPLPGKSKADMIRESFAKSREAQKLIDYKIDRNARDSLRRSMASSRAGNK